MGYSVTHVVSRLALGMAVAAPLSIAALPASAAAVPRVQFVKAYFDSPGSDRGGNKSVNGEYVVIRNTTRKPINLGGWLLRDANFRYTFGAVTLKPGKRLTIRSGQGTDTTTTLYWGRRWYVWNNDKDTAALYNVARRKVDSCSWNVSATTGPDQVSCL